MGKRTKNVVMSTQKQEKLYKIDRTIRSIMRVGFVISLILLVVASFQTPIKYILSILFFSVGGFSLFLLVCRIALSPFVKSDEEEEFEQKVDYILQKRSLQKVQVSSISSEYSPFVNLSEAQEEKVKSIMAQLPSNSSNPEAINMAIMAHYLTALEQLGYVTLTNKQSLRLWVSQVTHKKVPDTSHFNEALPSTNRKEVAKIRHQLEALLAQVEK